jgi:hypothetical protein
LLIAPGVTPIYDTNPGIVRFEIDDTTGIPKNLQYEFLNLEATLGKDSIESSDLEWRHLDMNEEFQLSDITATSLADFKVRLVNDQNLAVNWMIRKLGYDPTIQSEYTKAMGIYEELGLVTSPNDYSDFICLMHKNTCSSEIDACFAENDSSINSAQLLLKDKIKILVLIEILLT